MLSRRGLGYRGLPNGNPSRWISQTDFDLYGGNWFKFGGLTDGNIGTWTSNEGLSHVLTQATGSLQPVKSSSGVLFDGVDDALPRSATGNIAKFIRRATLPDSTFGMSSNGAGKGWTGTGLTRIPGTSQFWTGNHGDTSAAHDGSGPWAPSLIRINWSGGVVTKLQEIAVLPLIPGAQSIQGVTWDKSDGTLWFTIASGAAIGVYHINPDTGVLINDNFAATWAPNGLARVHASDKVWITEESSVGANIESRSLATGAVVNAAVATGLANLDMLHYDEDTGGLLLSNGANGSAGSIRCYGTSGASGAINTHGNIQLDTHADCIEGIVWEGRKLYVLSDSFYHSGADGLNQLVEYEIVPPYANVVSVYMRMKLVSTTPTDCIFELGGGADGPNDGYGIGIYIGSTTTMTISTNTGASGTTQRALISGATVPDLTAAYRNIRVVADKTNNLLSLFVGGSQITTASMAANVGGIPLSGIFRVGHGANASRFCNASVEDLMVVAGRADSLRQETYLSTL
jgi:hypothetical protein